MVALRREEIEYTPPLHLVEHVDDMWQEKADRFTVAALQEMFEQNIEKRMLTYATPSAFLKEGIKFPENHGPTFYQDDILDTFWETGRVAATGPRGLGKSAMSSWMIIYAWLYWYSLGIDWKIVTTAGSYRQLRFLWNEVHKWAALIDWERIGIPSSVGQQLQSMGIKTPDGISEGLAASPADSGKIEGVHATAVLFLIDEAKLVPDSTWDSIEGTFTNKARSIHGRQMIFAVSTPGARVGRFSDIHHMKKGLKDWTAKRVTLDDAIEAGQISKEFVELRREQWGEKSPLYQNQMLGQFSTTDDDGVIPLEWVLQAIERWEDMASVEEGIITELVTPSGTIRGIPGVAPDRIGVDVGDSGPDKSVVAPRWANVVGEVRRLGKGDPLETADRVMGIRDALGGGIPVVDANGVGSGTFAAIRRKGIRSVAFMAGAKSKDRRGRELSDRSGVVKYGNDRAAAWWYLREMLDPQNNEMVALPPDDDLTADLISPRYKEGMGGRLFIESKEQIRARLGRSTDSADAVVQSFWEAVPQGENAADTIPIPIAFTKVSGWYNTATEGVE